MKQSTLKVKAHNVAHLGPILGYGHWTASQSPFCYCLAISKCGHSSG